MVQRTQERTQERTQHFASRKMSELCPSNATEILSAYIYSEADGKKGGNNVCSLIWKKLNHDKIVEMAREHGPAKELCLVFDNCA